MLDENGRVKTASWFRENSTLIYFLIAQMIAIGAGAASILAYMVKLETRVAIMETRGAEYTVARMEDMKLKIASLEQSLKRIEETVDGMQASGDRITVLEQRIKQNESSIERLVQQYLRDQRDQIRNQQK